MIFPMITNVVLIIRSFRLFHICSSLFSNVSSLGSLILPPKFISRIANLQKGLFGGASILEIRAFLEVARIFYPFNFGGSEKMLILEVGMIMLFNFGGETK